MTTAAQHADRILAARQLANANHFETELASALASCRNRVPSSSLEWEQHELLETIVENWRGMSASPCARRPGGLEAELALLSHLRRCGPMLHAAQAA